MKKQIKKLTAVGLAGVMALSMTGCGSKESAPEQENTQAAAPAESTGEDVTIKIAWWGGQTRHDSTQKLLDMYTEEHPNVKFEAVPSGWDGYFDKLATQAASGSMPDIVQMDYLYITTYAQNNSLADLTPYIEDGTIDVSKIDENLLNTGKINDKMSGLVLATSYLAFGYNPEVYAAAGLEEPTSAWTWADFIDASAAIKEKTGFFGNASGPVDDTNLYNYWLRQHGSALFSEDNKTLGYTDDKICADYFTMWKDMMDQGLAPNPDEYAAIKTLGQEAGPVVTGEAGGMFEWNNYASKVSSVNDKIKVVTPPLADDSDSKGLWMKPGMFFSVAETSKVKKEAAEFINWFINSEEANDVILGERGTPVSSDIREYMVNSGKLSEQQIAMFEATDEAESLCGETPAPDPVGMSEINTSFKNIAYSVFYGQTTADEGAAQFRKEAEEILARNN